MKKALYTLLITIALGLILVVLLVVVADPFYHYHGPINREGVYLFNEVYQAPGEAAHFQYDTVMIGTSMTENYHVNWFNEYEESAIKLCYSGAKMANIGKLLDIIFTSGNDIKRVYIDINAYQLSESDPETLLDGVPEYLYDKNVLTDVNYIFNKDVVMASFECMGKYLKKNGNEDGAFTWEDDNLFGRERVIEDISGSHENQAWVNENDDNLDLRNKAKANINKLVSYVNENPETQFIFFYPPYSMAYWYQEKMSNTSIERLDMYLSSIEELMEYDNVDIYFFMDDYDTVCNLDNYRDMCHFKAEINKLMLEYMHNGSFKVESEEILDRINKLAEYIENYTIDEVAMIE